MLIHWDFLVMATARYHPSAKLQPKGFEPLQVIKKISSTAVELQLPADCKARPVFNPFSADDAYNYAS